MRICSVDGCGDKHSAKGFCSRHYAAWRRETAPNQVRRINARHQGSEKCKRTQRAYHQTRYGTDPEYRERKKRQAAQRRAQPGFNRARRVRYRTDRTHRESVKARVYARKQAVGVTPRKRADMERRHAVQGGRCGICRRALPEDPMSSEIHVDHIIPVARGGSGDESNLQLAHAFCNQEKWAHSPRAAP